MKDAEETARSRNFDPKGAECISIAEIIYRKILTGSQSKIDCAPVFHVRRPYMKAANQSAPFGLDFLGFHSTIILAVFILICGTFSHTTC